jgi:acetone carboxylase gamma subunit
MVTKFTHKSHFIFQNNGSCCGFWNYLRIHFDIFSNARKEILPLCPRLQWISHLGERFLRIARCTYMCVTNINDYKPESTIFIMQVISSHEVRNLWFPLRLQNLIWRKSAQFFCARYTHCLVAGSFAEAYLHGPEMKIAWNLLRYSVSAFKMCS